MRRALVGALAAAATAVTGCHRPAHAPVVPHNDAGGADKAAPAIDPASDPLALGDGHEIVLTGTVTDDGGAAQPASWALSIEGRFVRPAQIAWVVGGWPSTRVWGDSDQVTLVVLRDRTVWLAHPGADQVAAARAAVADGRLPEDAEPLLRWPPEAGAQLCPERDSPHRCWQVEADGDGYAVRFRTGPDDLTYLVHPHRGLIGFRYHHHGTVNDIDLRRD